MNPALSSALVFGLTHSVHMLPATMRNGLARRMANQQATYDKEFSSLVIGNLARAFPTAGRQRILELGMQNAERTSRAHLDFLWGWRASARQMRRRVHLDGTDLLVANSPLIIVGTHQLGFELAALRIAMELNGAIVIDPGARKLPDSAYKAWTRFNRQEIILPDGALRGCRAVLARHEAVLLLVDEPPSVGPEVPSAQVAGVNLRISPLVPMLRTRNQCPVVWFDVSTQESTNTYRMSISEMLADGEDCGVDKWLGLVSDRIEDQWKADPTGYWWARKKLN